MFAYSVGAIVVQGIFRRAEFYTGNIPHLSLQVKRTIPQLLNLECVGSERILGLQSPKDTQYSKAVSNNSSNVRIVKELNFTICVCLVGILFFFETC